MDCILELFNPKMRINKKTNIDEIKATLIDAGFKVTDVEGRGPIIHGEAWLNPNDKVVVHIYFSENVYQPDSLMLHSMRMHENDTILESFERKQRWLEEYYGKPTGVKFNSQYNIYDAEWDMKDFFVKHYIHDRFGDEEGIYIRIKARN